MRAVRVVSVFQGPDQSSGPRNEGQSTCFVGSRFSCVLNGLVQSGPLGGRFPALFAQCALGVGLPNLFERGQFLVGVRYLFPAGCPRAVPPVFLCCPWHSLFSIKSEVRPGSDFPIDPTNTFCDVVFVVSRPRQSSGPRNRGQSACFVGSVVVQRLCPIKWKANLSAGLASDGCKFT